MRHVGVMASCLLVLGRGGGPQQPPPPRPQPQPRPAQGNALQAYQAAEAAYTKKDCATAVAQYTRALDLPGLGPQQRFRAHYSRGYCYNILKQFALAKADYDVYIASNPRSSGAFNNRGNALSGLGLDDAAMAEYEQAIKLNPRDPLPYSNRCFIFVGRKEYDRAIADCTSAMRFDPKLSAAYLNRGDAYANKGQYDLALADFAKGASFDLKDPRPSRGRALVAWLKKDWVGAVREYTAALALAPDDVETLYNRGRAYENDQKYKEAIADFGEVLRLDPAHGDARFRRGFLYLERAVELEAAAADFSEIVRRQPNNAAAYHNLGAAHAKAQRLQAAVDAYTKAIEIDPKRGLTLNNRAANLRALGQFERALADYTEALRAKADDAVAHTGRADVFRDIGRYEEAVRDYTASLAVKPDDSLPYAWRGQIHLMTGDTARALVDFEAYSRLQPNAGYGPYARGLVLLVLDQPKEAEAQFQEALRRMPAATMYPILIYLAQARAGNADAALTALQAAAARIKTEEWPGPIWQLYLGTGSPEAVIGAATHENARTQAARQASAHYYIAAWYLLKNEDAKAAEHLRASAATNARSTTEFAMAQAELRKLEAKRK